MAVNPRYFFIANLMIFQLGWLLAVLGGNIALLAIIPLLVIHFILSSSRFDDLLAVSLLLFFGLLQDTLLIITGCLVIAGYELFPPPWLISLWILLGITLLHSLKWIYERPLVSAVSGAVAAPLSYMAGARLSGAEWGQPLWFCLLVIAFIWLLLLPLHRFLFVRFKYYVGC